MEKALKFIKENKPATPCLIIDLDTVQKKFDEFKKSFNETEIYYAMKANPHPEIMKLVVRNGGRFDCASIYEIEIALEAGARPEHISYGNTIKKSADIKRAHNLGIRLYAVDSVEEVEKIQENAPGSSVFCRILCDGEGAEWPLSKKFGCSPEMAKTVISYASEKGLKPEGVSFHVGSQQTNLETWKNAIQTTADIFHVMSLKGIDLNLINLGGGFPAHYENSKLKSLEVYGKEILGFITECFPDKKLRTIIEPGRGLVGDAGVIRSEVVLVSKKEADDPVRWVYIDIGKFGGLIETLDETIRYKIKTNHADNALVPSILAGPTCDSVDVLYEKNPLLLPKELTAGDELLIFGTGAYTTTYSSVAFNGFPPLASYAI